MPEEEAAPEFSVELFVVLGIVDKAVAGHVTGVRDAIDVGADIALAVSPISAPCEAKEAEPEEEVVNENSVELLAEQGAVDKAVRQHVPGVADASQPRGANAPASHQRAFCTLFMHLVTATSLVQLNSTALPSFPKNASDTEMTTGAEEGLSEAGVGPKACNKARTAMTHCITKL